MKKRIYLTLAIQASSGYNDLTWKAIFFDTLVEMGHDVVLYTYDQAATIDNKKSKNIADISSRIYSNFVEEHKKSRFDLFLGYYHALQVTPELFIKVKEHTLCVNYTTNFHQIDTYAPLLKVADLSIYASIEAKSYFDENNYTSYYMPFAGLKKNVSFDSNKNGMISFIGTSYGPRAYYLWRCLQNNLPIQIYGFNWLNNHKTKATLRTLILEKDILFNNPLMIDTAYKCLNDVILKEINSKYSSKIFSPLTDEEYVKLLTSSSIVLNFPESRYGHDFNNPNVLIGANLRDFEVPTTGSFLLTQDNKEINNFFEVGTEIETFGNEWELVDKLKFYINKPELILKIALAGNKRILKEHLWQHRFECLFKHLDQIFL